MKENLVYFKHNLKHGIRYGFFNSDQSYFKYGILTDVIDVYLSFTTGHYIYISHVDRIYPLFDDFVEITVDEYNKVRGLYNEYNAINSELDEESIKLFNNVH